MANANTSKSFQNKIYFLDSKSASTDFHDYTDNDFIEEYDDDDDDDDKTAEGDSMSSSCEDDDDEDKHDYNRLSRVFPLKTSLSQENLQQENDINGDSLDTINESIRESNYTLVAPKVAFNNIIMTQESTASVDNKLSTLPPQSQNINKNKNSNATKLTVVTHKRPSIEKQTSNMNNSSAKTTNVRTQSNDPKNRVKQNDNKKALNVMSKTTTTANSTNHDANKKLLVRQNTNSGYLINKPSTSDVNKKNVSTPSTIETSRIQKVSNEIVNHNEQVNKSTVTTLTEASNSTTNSKKSTLQSKSQINCKSNVNNKLSLNQKSQSSNTLEVNSNKISLKTKPPSAKSKKSSNSSTPNVCNESPKTVENVVIDSKTKIPNPISMTEPPLTIVDVFENFDHPFTIKPVQKSASIRSNSASQKCLNSTSRPKKSASMVRKKVKNGVKKSKIKQKKITVSKNEINVGYTTQYSLLNDENSENKNDLIFVNPPNRNDLGGNDDYDNDADDARSININNEIDDSSSESSDESLSNSNIPIFSIGDINAVAASQNEIEIDNGDSSNGDSKRAIHIDESLAMSNVVMIDEERLKTVSNKVEVLRARLDNVINASTNDSIRNDKTNTATDTAVAGETEKSSDEPIEQITNKQQQKDSNYYTRLSLHIDKANNSQIHEASKDSNSNLTSLRSTKTNVNIRDLYTMVNNSLRSKINNNEVGGLYEKSCQSLNSTLANKQGLPPRIPNKEIKSDKNYELPPVLSNKLNSLIEMRSTQNEIISNNIKKSPLSNYESVNNLVNSHQQEQQQPQQKGRVSRINYVIFIFSYSS